MAMDDLRKEHVRWHQPKMEAPLPRPKSMHEGDLMAEQDKSTSPRQSGTIELHKESNLIRNRTEHTDLRPADNEEITSKCSKLESILVLFLTHMTTCRIHKVESVKLLFHCCHTTRVRKKEAGQMDRNLVVRTAFSTMLVIRIIVPSTRGSQ